MAFGDLKELPHLVKPILLGLSIVLFIVVLIAEGSWYPILVACVQLLFTIAALLCFAFDVQIVHSILFPKVEMIYSLVFAGINILGGIIMFIQIFNRVWFASLFTVAIFALCAVTWGFNALQMWRGSAPSSSSSPSTGNQATAQAPFPGSGVNPGV